MWALFLLIIFVFIHLDIIIYLLWKCMLEENIEEPQKPINNTKKRTRERIAQTSYSNPLDPYAHFRNKQGLYEPRKAVGAIGANTKPIEEE